MAYKTGGYKTKYIESYGQIYNEYTIYCAVDSTTDLCSFKMFDDKGNEQDISITNEDDTDDYGKYSLIDCLYHLKHLKSKKYSFDLHNIEIRDMTNEEMTKIFGR